MTARDIINEAASYGVALSLRDGKVQYSGEAEAVASILPLLREHKDLIIRELSGEPSSAPASIPPNLTEDLLVCGYHASEWTPAGCRAFLAELMAEWPDFHVNGWCGCEFPACWPAHLMNAVQAVYAMGLQDLGEMER